jgi:hypothetical protein
MARSERVTERVRSAAAGAESLVARSMAREEKKNKPTVWGTRK